MIPLSSTDGGGIARAESTHQQRKEKPEEKARCRFARGVLHLPGLGDYVRDSFLRRSQTDSRLRGNQPRQIVLSAAGVSCR